MKLKGLFQILSALLVGILSITAYKVFYTSSSTYLFLAVEALIVITAIYLAIFYLHFIKPLQIIGNGMDLLKEQDFSSRLRRVGQSDADRIVDIFNKMMEQLKNERLRLREQNHFLDLVIQVSPLGVIILDLDERILSANPVIYKLFGFRSEENIIGKSLQEIDNPLVSELLKIEPDQSQIIRLNDANIYKCTHSSFIDKSFRHSFYLIELLTEEVFKAEMKAYERVIRMIAHEVNNTTAGITSTLDTLDQTLKKMEYTEDLSEVLQIAIERCYNMNRFIGNFADVVRIPEPQFCETALNELVTSGKRFMETICRNRNIKIVIEPSEISPVVKIDTSLFQQVLVNIIKNSTESIDCNGVIFIRTSNEPPCLEIADTGKGISREAEAGLFVPFFSTKPYGQGLGLIFIREVLLKHGCTFSLRTYPDGLTRFRILW
ncbi:MAG: PAS domain-containing protein [Dysgonamonadaceae bacterium]|jgi:nitrogen fixation/metabolism regulation signal transduction histidine kinase|nr:PAS domain-containing protein [Dysgonamonadaceae bacterium]